MTNLKIAIDGNEANTTNRVGSNVYAFEIITQLHSLIKNKHIEVTVLLSSPPQLDLPQENKKWHYKIITPKKFWTQWALPIHLFLHRHDYDVLFTPGHYAPRVSAIPYVSSVMDLAFLHYPEQFRKNDLLQLKSWTKYSVKHAKKVITISDFSKTDIIKHYHLDPNKIVVAYPAVKYKPELIAPVHKNKVLAKFKISSPYILYVGTIQPRKNLIKLVEAFEILARRLPLGRGRKIKSLQLVIAGKIGWLADDLTERIDISPLKRDIITTGFVTDFEKEVLLSSAQTLALIGLYEGFGIPALEALHHNLVPVVSNTSSLPEVIGQAGLLANPTDSNDIAKQLEKSLTMSSHDRSKYTRARSNQVSQFNWKDSARKILKTLEVVAAEHGNSTRN